MSVIDLHTLIEKLSSGLAKSLEAAAGLAIRHTHPSVELEHWICVLSETAGQEVLELCGVNPAAVRAEAEHAIEALRRGHDSAPAMSGPVVDLAREAWIATSLRFGQSEVTAPIFFLTAASDNTIRSCLRRIAPSLLDLNLARLEDLVKNTPAEGNSGSPHGTKAGGLSQGGEDFLAAYANDLTADASEGRLDRIVGRDAEVRQMVDILMRRRQNNPILLGEAGVGKTAIVEAFALMIADGEAPGKLNDVTLYTLDMNLLQAGAGVKGEFERRLNGLLDQVRNSDNPIILFIDEAHSLIGAGANAGQGDAANILKPALARGELRTIAATTWTEYKKYFEKDPALSRRFQPVKVDEPDIETAVRMMRKLARKFEEHHGVPIRDSAVRAAVELSARYLPERQLPDKAVSLIDTAAAAAAMSRQSEPEALVRHLREAEHLKTEIDALSSEPPQENTAERLEELKRDLASENADIDVLKNQLEEQMTLAAEADEIAASGDENALEDLAKAERNLADVAGEAPLIHRVVDAEAVASVVARWTGVPTGRLLRGQIEAVASLSDRLKTRILGQNTAIDLLSESMRVSRAGLNDERRPRGVFLMVGTSGVGKTETALALADELYGGSSGLTVINMSEFKEEHKISLLMGSPPGYVGYGEGGVLTEAVRRRPYGVLLLDELDKAHPGVQDLFYQVFDKGTLRDGEGRDVDFRNTTILMTANTGTEMLATLAEDPETMPDGRELAEVLKPELLAQFKPAFLGRLSVLPFLPLDQETLAGIVDLQLERIVDRIEATYSAKLSISKDARNVLVESARTSDSGARAIETMLSQRLLPRIADFFLDSLASGQIPQAVEVNVDANAAFNISAVGQQRRLVS